MPPEDVLPADTAQFVRALGPEPDDVIAEMAAYADERDFPTVGPTVGGWLALLVRLTDARRVFEFGSGFGYSAYWIARSLPSDGEVVLTEVDADELDRAREYMAAGGYDDRASYELGDAIETIDSYDGSFDLVLIDNEKDRYREAFETVREKVEPGGVVVADNVMTAGIVEFDALVALAEGNDPDTTEATRGVWEYLQHVRSASDFETGLLPIGEGLAVSVRVGKVPSR
ncbi:MAG: O-methyltransferase [Halorientalis sp.]